MRILCCFILSALSTVASAELIQVGSGVARWGLFKVYDAAFYTEANLTLEQALADNTAARLELCYARKLTVDTFIEGAQLGLPAQLTPEMEQAVQRLHSAYQPVQQGDCYHLSFTPEQGTQLFLNGRELVTVTTPGFKVHYFGIWLGAQPLSATLKRDLSQGLLR